VGRRANAEAGTWVVLLGRWVHGGYPPFVRRKAREEKDRKIDAPSTRKMTGMGGCPGVDS